MLNKVQAAIFLNVPLQKIDQFVAEGRLQVLYTGVNNQISFYYLNELTKLKGELDAQSRTLSKQATPDPQAAERFIDTLKLLGRIVDRLVPSADAYKGALSLQGASSVSGLSVSVLRKDIKAGKLKAGKVDGLWRIKRADFYAYLKKEWNQN